VILPRSGWKQQLPPLSRFLPSPLTPSIPVSKIAIKSFVHNIVFIDNPNISYIKLEDLDKFKRLSGVEELHVDREAARLQQLGFTFHDNCVLINKPMRKVENEFFGHF